MSRLEEFIRDNRNAFDDAKPSGDVWNQIEKTVVPTLNNTGSVRTISFAKWSMAAAAMLIISIVIVYYFSSVKTDVTPAAIAGKLDADNMLIPEVNEFTRMIVLKQEELKNVAREQPELYNKFTNDITQLDSAYKALKTQLRVTPNKEMLVEAMIQNLQLQLSVLNQQLNILKQIKQSKEYSHEKNI